MAAIGNRLKILFFVEEFLPASETFVYNQLLWLSNTHRVKVVCLRRSHSSLYPFSELYIAPGGDSLLEKMRLAFQSRLIFPGFRIPHLARYLESLLRDFPADLILSHFGLNAIFIKSSLPLTRIPLVFFIHGYDGSMLPNVSRNYRMKLTKLLMDKYSYPLFVCQALRKNLMSKLGINLPNTVHHVGIDTAYFQRTARNPQISSKLFVQVAGFLEKKGQETTIRSFAKWNDPQARLVFIGDGPKKAGCEILSARLGVKERVSFLGYQPPSEVKEWLQAANGFVHPSTTSRYGDKEGIPTVIMEAMAMELPILSTRHSGIAELVRHGENGFLAEEGDHKTLSRYFEKVLDLGKLKVNRLKVVRDFNGVIQNKKLNLLFKRIMASPHND